MSTRTVRRDLSTLQEAGFPIFDETVNGTKFWRFETRSLGVLARTGLTFSELCALYFSRALIECFAGTHLLADVQSALGKFEAALSPRMKQFVDRLPRVMTAKPAGAKRQDATTYQAIALFLDAILHQRVVAMRYHSRASRKEKDYVVHPQRLVHVQGGLYLWAFVPAYAELRTFAVERVRRVALQEESFTPIPELDTDPFKNSLGAYRGAVSRVQIRFHPQIASTRQGALVASVAASEGPLRRFGRDDDGYQRRLCLEELDPELWTIRARAGAAGARRLDCRGAGPRRAAVRIGSVAARG